MAGEIQLPYGVHAANLYALIRNTVGQIWRTDTHVFENYTTGNYANYTITLTEQGTASGYYTGTFPSQVAVGRYYTTTLLQAGGSPAETDTPVGSENFEWTGSAALSLAANLPANVSAGASGGLFIAGTNDHCAITNAFLVSGGVTYTSSSGVGFTCSSTHASTAGATFIGASAVGNNVGGAGLALVGGAGDTNPLSTTSAGGPALSAFGGSKQSGNRDGAGFNLVDGGSTYHVIFADPSNQAGASFIGPSFSTSCLLGATGSAVILHNNSGSFSTLAVTNASTSGIAAMFMGGTNYCALGGSNGWGIDAKGAAGGAIFADTTITYIATLGDAVDLCGAAFIGTPDILLDGDHSIQGYLAGIANPTFVGPGVVPKSPVQTNKALSNFSFVMYATGTNTPLAGLTVTPTRRIDAGAFAACANPVTAVGNGVYSINLAASDLNGSVVMFRMIAPGADDTEFSIVTQPTT